LHRPFLYKGLTKIGEKQMRENLFRKILGLEKNLADASVQKNIMSKHRKRKIIPDEYFIDVITIIPERKAVAKFESIDI